MGGPEDSGGTATLSGVATDIAAEETTDNALAEEEVAVLAHEAQINLCGNEPLSALISVRHGADSQIDIAENIPGTTEGPAAEVRGAGLCATSLDAKNPSKAGSHEDSLRYREALLPGVANSEEHISLSTSTGASSSSFPSSLIIKSGKDEYTSSEPLVDESSSESDSQSYESDSEETGDGKYRKIDKGKGKEIAPRGSDQESAPPAEGLQNKPPVNNVPWERAPERPPQKLPIRFTDCLGRNFVWPWIRARSWKVS